MLSQVIWWAGILVEVLLLVRGIQTRLAFRYRFFYSYILCVLSADVLRLAVYKVAPHLYSPVYWISELVALVAGCGVVYEVYKVGLAAYPGTARMARAVVASVFALVLVKLFADVAGDPGWWLVASRVEFELNLRVIQAVFIAALAVVFLGYSIPFGRNLKGMLVAYGLVVGSRIIRISFPSLGWAAFQNFEQYIPTFGYYLSLLLWLRYLWFYEPIPGSRMPMRLEDDYQRIAERTRRQLRAARGYLGKAVGL